SSGPCCGLDAFLSESDLACTVASFSQFAHQRGNQERQRVSTRAREQQRSCNQHLRERIFCTSIHNIEPIAKVNEENRSNHDNEPRSPADPEEDAGRHRQPAANLGRANQNCQEGWPVMRLGERLQPRSSEPSEQDGASVIEKRRPTGKSQKQERQIDTSDLPC